MLNGNFPSTLIDLQKELLEHSKAGRSDKLMRVAIATDNFGAFVRYISHDQELNPASRVHGTRQSMINDAGHMLVQAMTLVALCDINLDEAINSALVNLREKDFIKRADDGTEKMSGLVACEGGALAIGCQAWVINEGDNLIMPPDADAAQLILVISHPEADARLGRFAGIVTDQGGIGCHAGIISRERHIPCIVGTGKATKKIQTGDTIDMNLQTGEVRILIG